MSFWIILSWVGVAVLTGVNIFVFLKLKSASEQMLKMAFPGAKDMNEALQKMQAMMSGMQRSGMAAGNPQLRQAMEMLQKSQRR